MQNAIEPQMHGVAGEAENARHIIHRDRRNAVCRAARSSGRCGRPVRKTCKARRRRALAVRLAPVASMPFAVLKAPVTVALAPFAVLWAPIAVAALPVAFAFGPQAKALVLTAVSVVAGLVTQTGCATACRGAKLIPSATDKPVRTASRRDPLLSALPARRPAFRHCCVDPISARNGPDCAGDRLNHFYPPIARAIAIADGPLY